MPNVKVRENEPFEFALRRFKRTCEKAGILAETRKREFYEKPIKSASAKRPPRSSVTCVAWVATSPSVNACTDRRGGSVRQRRSQEIRSRCRASDIGFSCLRNVLR